MSMKVSVLYLMVIGRISSRISVRLTKNSAESFYRSLELNSEFSLIFDE